MKDLSLHALHGLKIKLAQVISISCTFLRIGRFSCFVKLMPQCMKFWVIICLNICLMAWSCTCPADVAGLWYQAPVAWLYQGQTDRAAELKQDQNSSHTLLSCFGILNEVILTTLGATNGTTGALLRSIVLTGMEAPFELTLKKLSN